MLLSSSRESGYHSVFWLVWGALDNCAYYSEHVWGVGFNYEPTDQTQQDYMYVIPAVKLPSTTLIFGGLRFQPFQHAGLLMNHVSHFKSFIDPEKERG